MCEFETATDAPITYAELEVLIRLIIEDFTLLKAAEIKKNFIIYQMIKLLLLDFQYRILLIIIPK